MPRLSLSLLGSLQVTLDGQPVTGFKSDKVRALLAYLAVETERPHRRESLSALLWPDILDRSARVNLRSALANLRRVIGDHDAVPPFLLISRESIQFNAAGEYWLDVQHLDNLLRSGAGEAERERERLEEAVSLYSGAFLDGFSLDDSTVFEDWSLYARERISRQISSALHRLAAIHEERAEYKTSRTYAWRLVEMEPWDEAAHRRLMRTLALDGQRSAALGHFQTCCRNLADELGVEPAAETVALYEQIRDGELEARLPEPEQRAPRAANMPPFLTQEASTEDERTLFVAREHELAQLESFLDLALHGHGQVTFVTGEAGSGKTSLVQEFAQRAQNLHNDLIIASGTSNAHTGIGDPYLPFREILAMLTGDVETRWAAGAITSEHACRLWSILPISAQTLVETGPDLIDLFIPGASLYQRAVASHPEDANWLTRLADRVEQHSIRAGQRTAASASPQQSALFAQYTETLQTIALHHPLVLLLDDLQWADLGSISLLFHLGRQSARYRVLIIGAFRREEVAVGRDGDRHPLSSVINELQRHFGDIMVDLDQCERRAFVDALLDSEPNRLGPSFRQMLFRQTRGHPLFTIELLRGMQERGDLVHDPDGRWNEGPSLDWNTLPARVEAAIAERIGRLAQELRDILRVASVEGVDFTAEVVARVLGASEREMVRSLSASLDRRHRLVQAQVIERVGSRRVSRYRFRHNVFQRYLYENLDPAERAYIHEDVGSALEDLYAEQESVIATVALQLARHFQEARVPEKAISYLHQAGDLAAQLSAFQEGIAHLTQALHLLNTLPDSHERVRQELDLQISLAIASKGEIPSRKGEEAINRALELCQLTGETTHLSRIVGELMIVPYVRAEHRTAQKLGEEALRLAQESGDPLLVALTHWQMGFVLFAMGEFTDARAHLQQMICFYDPQEHHHALVALRGSDAGVSALAYEACCLWCLGYPDQALERSQEALALARAFDHGFSLADVLCYGGCVFSEMRHDAAALKESAEVLMHVSEGMSASSFHGTGIFYQGEALTILGEYQLGITKMHEGLAIRLSVGARCNSTAMLGGLAEGLAGAGDLEQGLVTLAEALDLVKETDERYFMAELLRIRAEMLLSQRNDAGAEADYRQAIELAQKQGAKSWELRAATSLGRLMHQQGRNDEARQLVRPIYDWFSEGFDTGDLKEARALLDEIESSPGK